ncbi:hypothetical protein AB3K78_10025 [Leucobacter sp. HNU]|uniref:phosphotriesterase family protein n=1 Tax=Leucobacter sp. HNU TaxID=3236805 RepID=UPI003A7FD5B7
MGTVPGSGPAAAITAVRGPIPVDAVRDVLAAETLLRAPEVVRGNAGLPASDAEFQRAPVTIGILGRLLMGAENIEDRTLGEAEAAAALARFRAATAPGAPTAATATAVPADGPEGGAVRLVAALAGRGSTATGAALARLSAETGIAVVRGVDGLPCAADASSGDAAVEDPESVGLRILDALHAAEYPAGVVGAIPVSAPTSGDASAGPSARRRARLRAAAEAARQGGAALVLDLASSGADRAPGPATSTRDAADRALADALAAVDAAGLPRARTVLAGVATHVAASTGVDADRFAALLDLGTALCFDDLGRIPNVRTAVSDHDVALAILRAAERGAQDRILLSVGIRNRHRLTAFGGNGLEFTVEQFVPYLGMLGADTALQRAVGGANAARILARTAPEEPR